MKNFFILYFILIYTANVFSQITPIEIPEKYYMPLVKSNEVTIMEQNGSVAEQAWEVFALADNTITFNTSDFSSVRGRINFMQNFWVVDQRGDALHIVKGQLNFLRQLEQPDDYGWVKKSEMLLNSKCLRTEKGRISKKGMIVNIIDDIPDFQNIESLVLCKDPDLKIQDNKKEYKLFDLFYVYAYKNNSVLLGLSSEVTNRNQASTQIIGWAPRSRIVSFNSRVFVEPNWDENAANERKSKGKSAKVFADQFSAQRYIVTNQVRESLIYWNSDNYEKRFIGDWRRFPVLENIDNAGKILRIGVMGELKSKGGNISQEAYANKIIAAFDSTKQGKVLDDFTIESDEENDFVSDYTDALRFAINNQVRLGKLTPEQAEALLKKKFQFFIEGYIPMQPNNLDNPLFKYSLLMDQLEFAELLLIGQSLSKAWTGADRRRRLQDTWVEFLKKHTGLTREEAMSKTMEEITTMMYGVPSKTDLLNVQLANIVDPSVVSDQQISRYISGIKKKLGILEGILNQVSYDYMFSSNDKKYYWISLDLLP